MQSDRAEKHGLTVFYHGEALELADLRVDSEGKVFVVCRGCDHEMVRVQDGLLCRECHLVLDRQGTLDLVGNHVAAIRLWIRPIEPKVKRGWLVRLIHRLFRKTDRSLAG